MSQSGGRRQTFHRWASQAGQFRLETSGGTRGGTLVLGDLSRFQFFVFFWGEFGEDGLGLIVFRGNKLYCHLVEGLLVFSFWFFSCLLQMIFCITKISVLEIDPVGPAFETATSDSES